MVKESYYFSHDYHARNDRKLIKLRLKLKQHAKGIYWDLVEMLYENGGEKIPLIDLQDFADETNDDVELIYKIIKDFDLFQFNETHFWNDVVTERLNLRTEKSKKASESAKERWNKEKKKK